MEQRQVLDGVESDTSGWSESDVGEIIESLAMLYGDRERRQVVGAKGSEWIRENRTWAIHAKALSAFVLGLG